MKYLLLVLLVGLFSSCTTKRDKEIREASIMISYYEGLISYEKEVNTCLMNM